MFVSIFGVKAQGDFFRGNDSLRYAQIIDVEDFKSDLMAEIILSLINDYRHKRGIDSIVENQILKFAAEDQAEYMAINEYEDLYQTGAEKRDTRARLIYYGGSGVGYELTAKASPKKGADFRSYKQVADDIVFRWLKSSKTEQIIADPKIIFAGIHGSMDYNGKKIYLSAVFGNYRSFNEGAKRRDELEVPYTNKTYGLQLPDIKICRKCNKFNNLESLQKGLYVKDGLIYFKYDNLKRLKKIMREPTDGLMVDVVQVAQYDCSGPNIINNENPIKGIPTKVLWAPKMLKKNLITDPKERKQKIEVVIGKFPKALSHLDESEYELNLIVIQDKHICRNIHPFFEMKGDVEYNNPLDFLADTVVVGERKKYEPMAKDSKLTFKIPFEKAKYEYKAEDIEPFLKSLNQPDFVIEEMTIYAYSSIEGNDYQNEILQKKRAESIIKSLNDRQKTQIEKTNIITDSNWKDFVNDVQGTEYEFLSKMKESEAQKYIIDNNLADKLEPILKNHRYALIEMKVKYDMDKSREQSFVLDKFNEAIKNDDRINALLIQKYIFKKVLYDEYTAEAVTGMKIPQRAEYAGLLMNYYWLMRYISRNEDEEFNICSAVRKLYSMAPDNDYIKFNNVFCRFYNKEIKNLEEITSIQEEIDGLYETKLTKQTIDLLNLNFQFMIIDEFDEPDNTPDIVLNSLEKIKNIVDLEESNWQNSLKLAYIFIHNGDYEFAAKLLEPFVEKKVVFEELVYLFLSLCSRNPDRIYSNRFVSANKRAYQLNPERYCNLYKKRKFSVQVLENTLVKDFYCKKCNN
ncbi:MAG: hypothetical protein Kow0068_08310 [Marinilabiliales bacterium]